MTPARKWIKELVGTPTYLSVIFIGMTLSNGGYIALVVSLLFAVIVYNFTYEKIFPDYSVEGKAGKLGGFFVGQVIFWIMIFALISVL